MLHRRFYYSVGEKKYEAEIVEPIKKTTGWCLLLPGSGDIPLDRVTSGSIFLEQLAEALARNGLGTIRSAKTSLTCSRSPNSYEEEYVKPTICMINALKTKRPDIRISTVIGHSLGAHVAPLVVMSIPTIKGIVLLNAPFRPLNEIARSQIELAGMVSPDFVFECLQEIDPNLYIYLNNASKYDVRTGFKSIDVPALCILAGRDECIKTNEVSAWKTLKKDGAKIDIEWHPTLNHYCLPVSAQCIAPKSFPLSIFSARVPEYLVKRISMWIFKRLASDRHPIAFQDGRSEYAEPKRSTEYN